MTMLHLARILSGQSHTRWQIIAAGIFIAIWFGLDCVEAAYTFLGPAPVCTLE